MLKGLEMNGSRAAAGAGKAASMTGMPVRSPLLRARAPVSKRHQAFKSATVRVQASAEPAAASRQPRDRGFPVSQIKVGAEYEGRVVKVEQFGAFIEFGCQKQGLVHISQLADKFVKSAASVVQPNQTVRVRVMSVDADAGRIALSMKGLASAAGAAEDDEEQQEELDVEEEDAGFQGADDDEDEDEELMMEAPEGFEYVSAPEEPEIAFLMEQDDEDFTLESVAAFEALAPEQIERDIILERMPVPVGEVVQGKVTRVEEFGVFVEFTHDGRTHTALLERDEAKVPSAALKPKQVQEALGDDYEEGAVPEYVEWDIENVGEFYPVGKEVTAFVLDYNAKNQMSLTHFADWELQEAVATADFDFERDEEEAMELLSQGDIEPLAEDPLDLLDEAGQDGADQEEAAGAADAAFDATSEGQLRTEYAAMGYRLSKGPLTNKDMLSFPSRPLNRVNNLALNRSNLGLKETDFDGDEVTLDDFWTETFVVPKQALKRLGLKIQINEAGLPDVVEKEGAKAGEWSVQRALRKGHRERVAAFVQDILAADEDEAELPVRAMRRPAVLAAAVQNIAASAVKDLRNKTGAGMMDCKKALAENNGDVDKAIEWLRKKGLSGADKKAGRIAAEGAIASYIHPGARLGVLLEVNCETDFVAASENFQRLVGELGMLVASCPDVTVVSADEVDPEVLAKEREVEMGKEDIKSKPEAVRAKIVEGRIQKTRDNMALVNQASLRDPNKTVSDIIKETIAAVGENIQVRRFVRFNLGEGLEKRSNDFAAEVAQQTQAKAAAAPAAPAAPLAPKPAEPSAAKPTIQVAASVVKQLRDKTGAGMMDCKKALAENNGDMDASVEWLRKKGLASADKKAGRLAAEGALVSYIHPGSRLGVLLEINCETDFVAASEKFNALATSIAMQIAASPTVQYVTAEDIPAEVFAREKEIEMGREDLKNKPEAIRAKIAEGRVAKLAQDMALLPQPYLMDPGKTVEQAVKEAVAAIGEKISVRRFIKFQLGEGIEKRVSNLAAEVAAATGKA